MEPQPPLEQDCEQIDADRAAELPRKVYRCGGLAEIFRRQRLYRADVEGGNDQSQAPAADRKPQRQQPEAGGPGGERKEQARDGKTHQAAADDEPRRRAVGKPACKCDRRRERKAGRHEEIPGARRRVAGDILHEHGHEVGGSEQSQTIGERDQTGRAKPGVREQAQREQRRRDAKLPRNKAGGQGERQHSIGKRGRR